jgi:TolB-like protein
VIVGLIILNVISLTNRQKRPELPDKAIAVLPFRNDSPDEDNMYFINGTMEAILNNLSKIEDIRVPGRTSVEQYRDAARPIPEIAAALEVSYILEGSGQRLGNRVLLTLQLIDGKNDHHLWSRQYDRVIGNIEDLIDIQSEVAQLVAREINAIISPEEKARIELLPTTNLTAYDYYQQGKEEYWKYLNDPIGESSSLSLNRAKSMYQKALDYDSTFALAYVGLAEVYWSQQPVSEYSTEEYIDSVLVYANKAMNFNDQLASAYRIRGSYYIQHHQFEKAVRDLDIAIDLDPNDYETYEEKGRLYTAFLRDPQKALYNYHKALSLHHGRERSQLLETLAFEYFTSGFLQKAEEIFLRSFELHGDSAWYFFNWSMIEGNQNLKSSRDLLYKGYRFDSTNIGILTDLSHVLFLLGEYQESLRFIKSMENLGSPIHPIDYHRVAYIHQRIGMPGKAERYYDEAIKFNLETLAQGRGSESINYALAAIYAVRGERELAFEHLGKLPDRTAFYFSMKANLDKDPMFESIRNESEFQQIVQELEDKYQAEHEQVRQWLEKNEML